MENQFSTPDFYLSAALLAENYELLDYYRQGGFTTFLFSNTPALHEYVKIYYSEKALIEPVKYGRAIKNLKSLIHSISISTSKQGQNHGYNNNRKGNS